MNSSRFLDVLLVIGGIGIGAWFWMFLQLN